MEDRIRFTQHSGILDNEALGFEVDIDGKRFLDLYTRDDIKWEIMVNGSEHGETMIISWLEFLEIVYKMQKFVADENATVIDNLKKRDANEDEES